MNIAAVARSIFPPRRRALTAGALAPLGAFLLLFIGGNLFLVWHGILLFSKPWAFLLLLTTPWVWWMHMAGSSGLTRARGALALLVRLCLIGAFVMLLAEPRAVRTSNVLAVIYALDVSDSIGDQASDSALNFVTRTVAGKPEKDEAGLVVFGREAAVELPPRATFPLEAINSRVGKDATNLEKGLSLTAAMLPEDHPGRIVLISDGVPTEGNLSAALDQLSARHVPVDVLPIQYQFEHEVWLEKLELPKTVKAGETYEAAIILSSLAPGSGVLTLKENDNLIFKQDVQFAAGKNRYVLPIYLREPGYYEYVARIEVPPGMDGWPQNNIAINHLYLKGEGKVLLVTDPNGDARDWETLAQSLKRSRREVVQQPAYQFPRDSLSLLPYDCIIFANVAADAFDAVQLQAVKDAVFNLGVGFLMVGGKNSFGPGGYHRTPVEEALPVTMDITQKKVLPKGALVIVLHTCEFPEGNTWGKRVAKEAIRCLGAKDEVGVLVYGSQGEVWLFPLTPAGEYERLVTLINQAEISDMPTFTDPMRMGLGALMGSDAGTKHMIIISDGDPSPPPPDLMKEFVANKVSVSTVAIFPHGGEEVSVMKTIAGVTGGRYYYPQDPNLLPSIFIKEAKTLRRSMIQNQTFTPRVEFPSPILKGIGEMPPLRGYVLTTPKPRSEVVLRSPETEETDPVLATWRYGVGRAAAFTSDLSVNWAAAWVEWDRYDAFVKQLMIDISRVEEKSDLQLRTFAEGDSGVVSVEDFSPKESFLEVQARVTGPQQRSENVLLKQVAPGRYQAEFPLWGMGRYQVVAAAAGDGRNERATDGFAVPYSPEYLRFRSSTPTLELIAQRTGGRMLTGSETSQDIFLKDRQLRRSSRPVMDWFLILLACLIPLDVGIRRVQLDLDVLKGMLRFGRLKGESGTTLGALLRRKQEIKFAPEEPGEKRLPGHLPAGIGIPERRKAARPAEEAAPKPAAGQPPAEERPMTQRLLEIKKKWKKDPG
ncbi:MAG: glutamine amidotransferase [Candidatus Brocadiia bacterium]